MTTALAIPAERVDTALARLTHSLPSLNAAHHDRAAIERMVDALSVPADGTWLMARIAALLSPYYERDVPQGVREMEAEDWAEALAEFPEWAVTKAVRWWKSAENPNRKRRPLEGDIAARCKIEMDAVSAARIRLRLTAPVEPEPREVPAEDMDARRAAAEEIIAGFTGRNRMEAAE